MEDEGEQERLVVIFGTRAVEIWAITSAFWSNEIREGQLNGMRELATTAKAALHAVQWR